jgi:cytochrome c biogenesis protein CcdA
VTAWIPALAGAFWFGVLTAISPCLLATNVTAISFIARRVDKPKYVLISGLCYTFGQALAFVLLAALLVTSLVSVPVVSLWLQKYMFRLLGPLLIVVAMFLFKLIDVPVTGGRWQEAIRARAGTGGLWAAALLGILFAMSFCPTTAALFFGSLIPLAITHQSTVMLPLAYALGVAVPVLIFAVLVAVATHKVGQIFTRVQHLERYARVLTGAIFFVTGVFFTLAYTLDII